MDRAVGLQPYPCMHARGCPRVCQAHFDSQACNCVRSRSSNQAAVVTANSRPTWSSFWSCVPPRGSRYSAKLCANGSGFFWAQERRPTPGTKIWSHSEGVCDASASADSDQPDAAQLQASESGCMSLSDAESGELTGVVGAQAGSTVQGVAKWGSSLQDRFALKNILKTLVRNFQQATDEEIESTTSDELDPLVQWEQRKKDVIAEKERAVLTSPGFSFSAAGLLFPYHLGVCQCLIDHRYITENTPLAGSSAGALVCAVVAGGLSMEEALLATKKLAEDCRTFGTAFRLGAVLRAFLEDFLPDDAHIRASGRIRVAVTQVFQSPRGLLVDKFDSKEDLVNALFTSCFIPGYLAPRPVTVFRDRFCIDGGISLFMPPTAAETTVRVSAFPEASFGIRGVAISPDCNPSESRASTRQLLKWALEPASDDILEDLFGQGQRDALVWVRKTEMARDTETVRPG